jgi:DNA-binding GntR family transcriptional regulator
LRGAAAAGHDQPVMPRPRTSDAVAAFLLERIFEGSLSAGQRVNLDTLATRLGVGRDSVREGLAPLERDGLVRVVHHRGVFVAPFDAGTIREAFDLYGLLTARVFRAAADGVAAHGAPELVAALAAQDEVLAACTDVDEFAAAAAQFHRVAVVAVAGPRLRAMLRSFGGLVPAATRLSIVEAMAEERCALHALFATVRGGDAGAAAAVATDHAVLTADNAIRELRRRGVLDGPVDDLAERGEHLELVRRLDERASGPVEHHGWDADVARVAQVRLVDSSARPVPAQRWAG